MPKFVWTEAAERELRHAFTQEGLSFAAIAAKLGTTRNAVAGKVWRLGLIGQGRNPPTRAAGRRAGPAEPAPSCFWPIGDPKSPDFHFCGAAVEPGATYCLAHSAQAYLPSSRGPETGSAPHRRTKVDA